jgi:hypothetical protein
VGVVVLLLVVGRIIRYAVLLAWLHSQQRLRVVEGAGPVVAVISGSGLGMLLELVVRFFAIPGFDPDTGEFLVLPALNFTGEGDNRLLVGQVLLGQFPLHLLHPFALTNFLKGSPLLRLELQYPDNQFLTLLRNLHPELILPDLHLMFDFVERFTLERRAPM